MRLLISDANILIDVEVAGLTEVLFGLDHTFAVPDILYAEELAARHGRLIALGLKVMELAPELIATVEAWAAIYRVASRHDLSAMALAKDKGCPLLTGDRALREAAHQEDVTVRGTLWLMEEVLHAGRIDLACAASRKNSTPADENPMPTLDWIGKQAVVKHHKDVRTFPTACWSRCPSFPAAAPPAATPSSRATTCMP